HIFLAHRLVKLRASSQADRCPCLENPTHHCKQRTLNSNALKFRRADLKWPLFCNQRLKLAPRIRAFVNYLELCVEFLKNSNRISLTRLRQVEPANHMVYRYLTRLDSRAIEPRHDRHQHKRSSELAAMIDECITSKQIECVIDRLVGQLLPRALDQGFVF